MNIKTFTQRTFSQSGQMLVEILITVGLFAVLTPALLTGFIEPMQSKAQQEQFTTSTSLMKETREAIRSVRERGWASFAVNGTFHPVLTNGLWTLVSGADSVSGLTRSVVVSDVYRNAAGQIITSGGTLDPSTKKVVTTLSWTVPRIGTTSTTDYITRYLDNLTYFRTTDADFNGVVGNASGAATINTRVKNYGGTDNGHVELYGVSNGDWCNPTGHIVAQMNLSSSGKARDVKAVEGLAYTGTNSGTGTFVQIGISNADPPVLTNIHTLTGYATNDVFIDSHYAYIATSNHSKDIVIIDMNTNTEVGTFDDGFNNRTAQGVYVVGNVGYATIGEDFYTFDLSSKSGSRPKLSSMCLLSPCGSDHTVQVGYRFVVNGSYAYMAIDANVPPAPLNEFEIVNVSNPASMTLASGISVNRQAGREVAVSADGTRAYLATSVSPSNDPESPKEVFILNTSNKSSLSVVGSYEANGMDPKGIAQVSNRVIVVGTSGEEYQVLNITNEASPVRCGGLQVNNGIYGVASIVEADNQAYSYIVTGDSTNEFKVILGGPGGSGTHFVPSGVFESPAFDASLSASFNRIDGTLLIPSLTTLSYQGAVATASAGSCSGSTYSYLGPDGTSASTYTATGGAIPLKTLGAYTNPGRCLRYKGTFTSSDTATSSAIYDVRVNYSP